MFRLLCEQVSPGLRAADAIVSLLDVNGRRHFLQIERDLLVCQKGHSYLLVAAVQRDAPTGAVLIELPYEAETGVNRFWVGVEKILDVSEVRA